MATLWLWRQVAAQWFPLEGGWSFYFYISQSLAVDCAEGLGIPTQAKHLASGEVRFPEKRVAVGHSSQDSNSLGAAQCQQHFLSPTPTPASHR